MGQMTCTWFLFAIIDSGTLAALNPLDLYFSICRVGGIMLAVEGLLVAALCLFSPFSFVSQSHSLGAALCPVKALIS